MLEIVGEIVEIGALQNIKENHPDLGLVLKTKEGVFITVSGLAVGDLMNIPNVLYKRARITIELPNAMVRGAAFYNLKHEA